MNPSKRDAWPQPARWSHCRVHFSRAPQPPPAPGLILAWRRDTKQWRAWVIWLDNTGTGQTMKQGCLSVGVPRPAKSDINVCNDGPWR